MKKLNNLKTFEKYGTNYSVDNWASFLTYIIKYNITPQVLDRKKIGGEYSYVIPVKSFKQDIERYFTKDSFFSFPIKYVKIIFQFDFNLYVNAVTGASFHGFDNDINMDKFNVFNINTEYPTLNTLEIKLNIKTTKLNWEAYYKDLHFWDKINSLNSVLQHEIHHAYEEYEMKLKGINPYKTKDNNLDITIRKVWNDFPDVMLLTKFIYLLTSHEINARITQLYSILKNENIKTQKEFLDAVSKTAPWKDYLILKNYDPSAYIYHFKDSFNEEEVNTFLTLWDKYKGDKLPNFKNIDDFFNYWKPQTVKKSELMKNKILKIWTLIKQEKYQTE